jgi:hypothetical protein
MPSYSAGAWYAGLHNAGYVPVVGDSFVVMAFDQRLGNFIFNAVTTQGYGPGITFQAVYNPHDVTLVVVSAPVPEPGTYALMLVGLGLLGVVLVRRRSSHAPRQA